jgi:Protein of unknown function (DUF1580)
MTISIKIEHPIPLGQVPKLPCIPRRRGGGKLHSSTVWRWALRGVRGVKLEVIRVGGTLCTSMEALQRFFDRLAGDPAKVGATTSSRSTSDQAEIERRLDTLGVTGKGRVRSTGSQTDEVGSDSTTRNPSSTKAASRPGTTNRVAQTERKCNDACIEPATGR